MIGALLEIVSLALTTSEESRDLLEIPDDRYQVRATAIAVGSHAVWPIFDGFFSNWLSALEGSIGTLDGS